MTTLNDQARQFDRLPPHSIESEMMLIGSMIVCEPDRKKIFAAVRSIVAREDFFQADHQAYFQVLCDMHDAGTAIDGGTVAEEMKRRHLWEEVGGRDYLVKILHHTVSYAHAQTYARTIKEKSLLRSLIGLSNEAIRECYAPTHEDNAETLLMSFASKASRLATGAKANAVHRLRDILSEVMTAQESGIKKFIPTGLASLDAVIGGLPVGGKMIIGAKPGMGKSAMIKQLLRRIAASMPVGLITIEETRHKVGVNLLSNESGVPNNRIAFGTAGREEWNEIVSAAASMDNLPIYVVDCVRKTSEIVAMANVLACQYGCRVIAVDHLHIISPDSRNLSREQQISEISGELKWAWKDLNVAGIEAAQLNRNSGHDRPDIDSLRDSGSLGQDGDTILMLHREDYFRKQSGEGELDGILEVIVVKNKNGAMATVPLKFDEARQRIRDLDLDPFNPF